jgi:hypothetical protein
MDVKPATAFQFSFDVVVQRAFAFDRRFGGGGSAASHHFVFGGCDWHDGILAFGFSGRKKKNNFFVDAPLWLWHSRVVKNNPLKEKIRLLRVKGVPVIVKTHLDRLNCHNYARQFNVEIKTIRRLSGGIEIHRVK